MIANELFVFLRGYNEENDYLWDFGDEGSSEDPFPSLQYETDGPYVLCMTVSNEAADCSETFCTTLSLDSLGWINGLQDGFSIGLETKCSARSSTAGQRMPSFPSGTTLHRACTSFSFCRATSRVACGGWFAEGHRMNGFSLL